MERGLTDILNIRGLELDPARTAEADDGITIGIKRRPEPDTICHHCYANRLAPNGARLVSYADLPVRGKPVTLEWDRQRYLCGACGKSVPSPFPALAPHHRLDLLPSRLGICARLLLALGDGKNWLETVAHLAASFVAGERGWIRTSMKPVMSERLCR